MRFSGFDDEWTTFKLDEIITLMQSGLSRQLSVEDIGVPVLRSNNIVNGQIDVSDIKFWYLIDTKGSRTENYFLKKDDLLVNFINSLGKMGKSAVYNDELKRPTIFTTNLMRLNFKKDIDTYFIYYFFNTTIYKNYIDKITKPAVNQASFTTKDFKKMELKIPTMHEQFKISKFLKHIDKKIELLENKLEYYQDFKKYLMQQIFTQKLRFDYDMIKLKDICKINKGKQLNKDAMIENGKYYVLNGGKEPSGYTNEWNTSENTITISEGGNSCGYVNFNTEKFWSGGHCYYLSDLHENVDDYYLYSYLKFKEEFIMRLRVGSGLPNIQKGDIENIKIQIVSKDNQNKISNLLLSADKKINSIQIQKENFENFKKGLLQQMFVVQLILSLLQNKKHI